jgi:hypothetical protein
MESDNSENMRFRCCNLGGFPVNTSWRVFGLRMEEWPNESGSVGVWCSGYLYHAFLFQSSHNS